MFTFTACKHELPGEDLFPVAANVQVKIPCAGCTTDPVCAVTDDIQVNENTTFTVCEPMPLGQGSFQWTSRDCFTWTPDATSTEIVKTCFIACTQGVCDTTFITIFPPDDVPSMPCSPDSVYFENDILPILLTNCAFSGCHNQASASDGVVLDSYSKIVQTGKVRPGNPGNSDLYEAITETKPDKVMPPPPATRLSADQISKIETWIRQGAKNNACSQSGCDTTNVSYQNFIKPKLAGCTTCHNASNQSGNIRLDTYAGVKAVALNGKLVGSVSWSPGYVNMPLGGSKLDACSVMKIKSWVDAGSPKN